MRLRGRAVRPTLAVVALTAGLGGALAVSSASSASSPPSIITGGQTIASGAELQSADGHYALEMNPDGDLQEIEPSSTSGDVLWHSDTDVAGSYAVLEPTGDLVVEDGQGTVWSDNEPISSGCPALNLRNDGIIEIDGPSSAAWQNIGAVDTLHNGDVLEPGQAIISQNGDNFELQMQTDGNLVLKDNEGNALWETYTSGNPGAYAVLGNDGHLAVDASGSGAELWNDGNDGAAGDHVQVTGQGNLIMYASDGSVIYDFTPNGGAIGTGVITPGVQFGTSAACPASATPPASTSSTDTTGTPTSTPTVTVTSPTSTVVTVGTPSPPGSGRGTGTTKSKLGDLNLQVEYDWIPKGSFSYLKSITFTKLPPGLQWAASITTPARKSAGGKAITKARTITYRAPTVALRRKLLLWLEDRRYSVGQKVTISLTRTRYTPEVVTFTVRLHRTPSYTERGVSAKKTTGKK